MLLDDIRLPALVLATPLYVDGMSGPLKNLLDRMIPLLEPEFELRGGHCRHALRENVKQGRLVLVSSCGFHELDNFDPLLVHVCAACENLGRDSVSMCTAAPSTADRP